MQIRDLTTIEEFRQVVDLEREIWGYTDNADMVGIPVFIFTVHRGATLIGAFDPATPPAEPWPGKIAATIFSSYQKCLSSTRFGNIDPSGT